MVLLATRELERKAQQNAYAREWRKKNPESSRAACRRYNARNKERRKAYDASRVDIRKHQVLKRRYDISLETYNRLVEEQCGLCGLCGEALGPRPHTDHNHETGRVRGVLCAGCNHGLGYIEKPGFVKRALEYLESSGG